METMTLNVDNLTIDTFQYLKQHFKGHTIRIDVVSNEFETEKKHALGVQLLEETMQEAAKVWEEKGYTDETIKELLNE